MQWLVHGERQIYANPWVNRWLVDIDHPNGRRWEHHVLWPSALLTAVAWEAAFRLGESGAAPVPTELQVEMLRRHGRGARVDRIVEIGMEPHRHRLTRREAALRHRQMGNLTCL
jgi:hypothetical protein